MDISAIEAIEAIGAGPLTFRLNGQRHAMPLPHALKFHEILAILHLQDWPAAIPSKATVRQSRRVVERWQAHHDLPTFRDCQRLLYLVAKYRRELEYDLQNHLATDLNTLFKARDWRRLLNMIDHLPRNAWYTEAVSNDEEHAEMIAKSMAESPDNAAPAAPPLRTWSQEASILADVMDQLRRIEATIVGAAGGKPGKSAPYTRPETALQRALQRGVHERKSANHKALVGRLLPHKAEKPD